MKDIKTTTITVDKKELELLAKKGSEWVIARDAEAYIERLSIVKEWIDEALEEVKNGLIASLSEHSPDTTTIRGKKFSAFLRPYGDKYDTTNPDFLREVSYSRTDSTKIDQYKLRTGELPEGTTEKAQHIKCVFRKK